MNQQQQDLYNSIEDPFHGSPTQDPNPVLESTRALLEDHLSFNSNISNTSTNSKSKHSNLQSSGDARDTQETPPPAYDQLNGNAGGKRAGTPELGPGGSALNGGLVSEVVSVSAPRSASSLAPPNGGLGLGPGPGPAPATPNKSRTAANRQPQRPPQRYIHCKVCHAFINVTTKMHQPVVRCTNCKEATPIRGPPPGKQYVRCPCNCLLICKANSSRILCPRQDCGRTIAITKTVQNRPGTMGNLVNSPNLQHLQAFGIQNSNQNQLSHPQVHSPFSDRRRRAFGQNCNSNNIGNSASNNSLATNTSVYSANSFNNISSVNASANEPNSQSEIVPGTSYLSAFNNGQQHLHHHHQNNQNQNLGNICNNGVIDAGSTEQLITTEGPNGSQSIQTIRTVVSKQAPKLVRLQCAYCHMEFVRLTPLIPYGTCPHCGTSTPFGNRYRNTRFAIFLVLAVVVFATGLAFQITGCLDKTEDKSNLTFNILYIIMYLLSVIFTGISIRFCCMKVTHISESEI